MKRVITKTEYEFLSKNPHFSFDGVKYSIKTALEALYPEGVSENVFLNPKQRWDKAYKLCGAWIGGKHEQ